ncbi:MAG TPA: response regulator transcription factor [Mycobacteriales bacterium]|nr:response regulator transcription factor [Mycobacteriales bacterium]
MVVDDAANLRELLTLLLETEDDFEVIGTASDGAQALAVGEALRPDIVLLDLAMPVMDGMQALPQLRERLPGALIVIFSGFEQADLVDEAMAAGANAYLEKGASVTQLVDLLRELRGRRVTAE